MGELVADGRLRRSPLRRPGPIAAVWLLALVLAGVNGVTRWAPAPSGDGMAATLQAEMTELLLWEVFLPRLAVSLLAGAALALSGALLQSALRNPLAEPATLGVSAGAQLALAVATIYAPAWLDGYGQVAICLAGAILAIALVFALAARGGLEPTSLVMAGLIVGLYAGTLSAALSLFHRHYLTGLFIWSSGSLVQNGWGGALALVVTLALSVAASLLIRRPLGLLAVDDAGARSLGVPVATIRLLAAAIAVLLAAVVAAHVGMIAFIGLLAPALLRTVGGEGRHRRLLYAPVLGAGLLLLADQFVQLAPTPRELPTGAVTALIGGALLLWLLRRQPATAAEIAMPAPPVAMVGSCAQRGFVLVALVLLGGGTLASLAFGQGAAGWHWASGEALAGLMSWRAPRTVAAAAAGAMLAVAGALIQRLSGNPMASPEILGVTSAAALGLIVLLFIVPGAGPELQLLALAAGAGLALFGLLAMLKGGRLPPERLLLSGVALGAVFSALAAALMASGDPRMAVLMNWLAGSTYRIGAEDARRAAIAALLLLAPLALISRPLALLSLGTAPAVALGLAVGRARALVITLTALLTAAATLLVGPLSFVGLMGPHLARLCGLRSVATHLCGSAILGALVMVTADWAGRNLIFPYQVPAGLMATLFAGPWLIALSAAHGRSSA